MYRLFIFTVTAITKIYTLSLHDALPIFLQAALDAIITLDNQGRVVEWNPAAARMFGHSEAEAMGANLSRLILRSEEHTSELQARRDLVCRLLLEKKKNNN